jgi:hypothetical protein
VKVTPLSRSTNRKIPLSPASIPNASPDQPTEPHNPIERQATWTPKTLGQDDEGHVGFKYWQRSIWTCAGKITAGVCCDGCACPRKYGRGQREVWDHRWPMLDSRSTIRPSMVISLYCIGHIPTPLSSKTIPPLLRMLDQTRAGLRISKIIHREHSRHIFYVGILL